MRKKQDQEFDPTKPLKARAPASWFLPDPFGQVIVKPSDIWKLHRSESADEAD